MDKITITISFISIVISVISFFASYRSYKAQLAQVELDIRPLITRARERYEDKVLSFE